MKSTHVDILLIGAGQSGLAVAYYLRRKNKKFLLVETNKKIGDSWRNRYDSLVLFTPRKDDVLPGVSFSGDQEGLPSKDEVADYLEGYAKHFDFPIRLNTAIEKISKEGERFIAYSESETFVANQVVVSTGAFQKPLIPSGYNFSSSVLQLHSAEYRNSKQIPKGSVLVIGGGHSGIQIAAELSHSHPVVLVTKRKMVFSNKYDIFYTLLSKLVPTETIRSIVDLFGIRKVYTPEIADLVKKGSVRIKKKIEKVDKKKVYFNDGSKEEFGTIIWATGYASDYSWIQIPQAFDVDGILKEKEGVSFCKGLYFVYPRKDYGFIKDLPTRAKRLSSYLLDSML